MREPSSMGERLAIELPAVPERVPAARGAISRLCERLEIEDALAADIRLAVTEACTNAVLHAYEGARPGRPRTFALEARLEDDELLVVVRDSGSGVLRPQSGRGGLGYGLGLMRRLASSVDVLARPGRGTCVAMRFALG
jgi:anti-sigma regulatory factor (Ser/Thr protein kinase)